MTNTHCCCCFCLPIVCRSIYWWSTIITTTTMENVRKHIQTYERRRKMNWSMWTNNSLFGVHLRCYGGRERIERRRRRRRKEKMRTNGGLPTVSMWRCCSTHLSKRRRQRRSKWSWTHRIIEWMLAFLDENRGEREREKKEKELVFNLCQMRGWKYERDEYPV